MTTHLTRGDTAMLRAPHPAEAASPVLVAPVADLRLLLTDLLATASTDPSLPMIAAVQLHTAGDQSGHTLLVGTSTDRYRLAQAHIRLTEPARLPDTLLPTLGVRVLLAALGPAPKDTSTTEGTCRVEVGPAGLTLHHDGPVAVRIDRVSEFPPIRHLFGDQRPASEHGTLSAAAVRLLAEIADRRHAPVQVCPRGAGTPIHVQIGDRYRAVFAAAGTDQLTPVPVFDSFTETTARSVGVA
jgi:hypothetical protein